MSSSDTAQRSGRVRIRELAHGDERGLRAVAEIHEQLIDFGPLAALGRDFLRVVGYRMPMRDGLLVVALAEVDGRPAGFAAYTADSAAFHARAIRRHWLLAGWRMVVALVSDPRRLRAVPRIVRVMRSRVTDEEDRERFGEIIGLAVRPEYVSAEFRKRTGRWLSGELVQHAADNLCRSGCSRLRMFVAAENTRTLLLYQFLGARFERLAHGGEPTVAVTFDLPMRPWGS